jgi:hypothetical protein
VSLRSTVIKAIAPRRRKLLELVSLRLEVAENRLSRKIRMYIVVKYCRKKCTLAMMADKFELSISDLNMAVHRVHRFKLQTKKNKKMQKIIAELCEVIEVKCKNV